MEAPAERRPHVGAVTSAPALASPTPTTQSGIQAHTTALQDGLAMVTRATALDKEKRYKDAANAYNLSLMLFDKALQDEKDSAMVALIEGKCAGYRKRLRAIEDHLATIVEATPAAQVVQQPRAPAVHASHTIDFSDLRSQLEAPVQLQPRFQSQPTLTRHGGVASPSSTPSYAAPINYRTFASQESQPKPLSLSSPATSTPAAQPAHLAFLAELSQAEMDDQEFLTEQKSSVADNPQVFDIVSSAARQMQMGKVEESKGNYSGAVRYYQAGLNSLERAHNMEENSAIKSVLDVKLGCYKTRVEEIQLITGKHASTSVSVAAAIKMADMYSKKARELVDNFQVDEAMEFYNKARAELMSALEREDVIEARKWIAKRVLIYERRVLNLNKVTRFIRIALPPPWGTLFGVAEGVVRASGIGSFAQKKLDGVLEKAATEDDVFKKFDQATKLGSSKSKAKRKQGQKAAENLRPITVDDIFAPIPGAEDSKKKGKKK